MRDSYDYDLFLSYRRAYPVGDWVHNHFGKQLASWLGESAPFEPRIFIDDQIETGAEWPMQLRAALRRSCVLVCVWSPSYFRSPWCVAELETMRERERRLNLRTEAAPQGLIFPVRFHDGEHFPPNVSTIQYFDVSKVNRPEMSFRDSVEFLGLIERVQELSRDVAAAIQRVPPWSESWPVVTPEPEDPGNVLPVGLPRL
jgi:hypothetical protein